MSSKYTKEMLIPLVKDSISTMDVVRKLGLRVAGGNHRRISELIKLYEIPVEHFLGQASRTGISPKNKRTTSEILVIREDRIKENVTILRRALIENGISHKCLWCGLPPEWNGKHLVLQVDHINGIYYDNRIENLRFLCPNCHTQTNTFGSKHKHALVPQWYDGSV